MKPIVDGIEQQYKSRLNIIHLDIQSDTGRTLAVLYGFQFTPSFIFFDVQGKEVWRSIGRLDVNQVSNSLK